MNLKRPFAIFIMGVSGVGKSTIGKLLANELGIPFFDGDDYHPKENITKMNAGEALNDDDRHPWLQSLNTLAKEQIIKNSCVIACSSLKSSYRDILKKDIESQVKIVFLNGNFDLIKQRCEKRQHFMPTSLLQSQFATLEEPLEAIKVEITSQPEEIIDTVKMELLDKSEFGVIGLGVMGSSLARNLASHNFQISIFNRHVTGIEEDIAVKAVRDFEELSSAKPFDDLRDFVDSLQKPRKILLMVNAGKPVDAVLENLLPLLDENDVVIDGGNSHYENTFQRAKSLKKGGVHFIGAGVSGGEEGALKGPSIMPSGNEKGYELVKPFLEKIAAKDKNDNPCCTYIGPQGSGHFVKMVHNGIEYAEMQLLAEVYFILKNSGKTPDEISLILESWKSSANSYLLEITIDILRTKEGNNWLIDTILDASGNKGTGNWATVASAELGMPSTMISSALFARYISSFKDQRIAISEKYPNLTNKSVDIAFDDLFSAYQFGRLINHSQGFLLLKQSSSAFKWNLNLSAIARIWTNGCIIRSDLMEALVKVLEHSEDILLERSISSQIKILYPNTIEVLTKCIIHEIPIPCLSESVNYFNGYKTENSSANLIQAQRDYFGAHMYQKIDDPTGKFYHTEWKKAKTND